LWSCSLFFFRVGFPGFSFLLIVAILLQFESGLVRSGHKSHWWVQNSISHLMLSCYYWCFSISYIS
jgi:hypothetical protein